MAIVTELGFVEVVPTIDDVVLVYSLSGDYADAQILDDAAFPMQDANLRIRAIVNPSDPENPDIDNESTNSLTGDVTITPETFTGPHGIWLLNGEQYFYLNPPQPRDDDYGPPYDMNALADIELSPSPELQSITFRADYDDGTVEDHTVTFLVEAAPIISTINPVIETELAPRMQLHEAINPAIDNQISRSIPTGEVVSTWAGDEAIPAGFPNSTNTGTPAGWEPVTTINGSHSINGGVLEDYLITGRLEITGNATLRRCEIRGEVVEADWPETPNGDKVAHLIDCGSNTVKFEDCNLGPRIRLAVLAADINPGDFTVDIDHSGTEFEATGFPFGEWDSRPTNASTGGHTYLMFCQEDATKEQYRTIGSQDLGNGIWRYTLGEEYGDNPGDTPANFSWSGGGTGWRGSWSGFRWSHAAGNHCSVYIAIVDHYIPTNTVGGQLTGTNADGWSLEMQRCNIHGGGDGVKLAGQGTTDGNALLKDCYIHDWWYFDSLHNDAAQKHANGEALLLHCTADGVMEATNCIRFSNVIKDANIKTTLAYSYVSAGYTSACVQFSGNRPGDPGSVLYNRWGRTMGNTTHALVLGTSPTEIIDCRFSWSGTLALGNSVTAGDAIPNGTRNGGADGEADKWASGYNTKTVNILGNNVVLWENSFALPGNPEFSG